MREKRIEQAMVLAVKKLGGLAPKLTVPGMDGFPDRIVLLPEGKIAFMEMKAPGKKPRPLQRHRHPQLRDLGFRVYVVDELTQIQEVLNDLRAP